MKGLTILKTNEIRVRLPDVVGKGYGKFWRFRGRYRVIKGSRASKKSKTTALWFIVHMMKYPDANLLVVRRVFNTLKDSCWTDLKWAANRLRVADKWKFTVSPLEATYMPTGQKILFRGLDDPLRIASVTVEKGYLCWAWIEEAYEIEKESDFNMIDESIRGEIPDETGLFKQLTLTFNPWSESFWGKKRFFDAPETPDILAMTTNYMCNEWLDDADRKMFETMKIENPKRYLVAGLGNWGIDGGQVFEEFIDDVEHYDDRIGSNVIAPFRIPKEWLIYRGFDFGYSKPFSVGWYAADHDGRLYRIRELYGCTGEPDEGLKWSPNRIAEEIARIEDEDDNLHSRRIIGIADPSIFDESRGESVAAMMERYRVYFEPADNTRMAGKMQCHYRLAFDDNGIPMFYVFSTCKNFIRTIPLLKYSEHNPEDVDTKMEDHIYDEWRYVCMENPIAPRMEKQREIVLDDPLDLHKSSYVYNKFDYLNR